MASEIHESNVQIIEGSGPKSVDCNVEVKKDLSNLCDQPATLEKVEPKNTTDQDSAAKAS